MTRPLKNQMAIVFGLCVLGLICGPCAGKKSRGREINTVNAPGILWSNPTDLASRNLFWGPGGEEHQPHGPFLFVKEDMEGTSPKFTVVDKDGVKWKVKLGLEARPETAASRLVWSVGYYTNEDYHMDDLKVQDLPTLQRGQKLVGPDGVIHNVRLKREEKGDKKTGIWRWNDNPWTGTRELNGLRVLMALIDNWDLKDENNAVYEKDGQRIYMVSDLGASFGTPGRSWPKEKAKDNLEEYSRAKFIRAYAGDTVDLATPARPRWVYLVDPKEYFSRVHLESLGKKIPRDDARWMGQLLANLSPNQIRDALRASGYAPDEVERFAQVLQTRIAQLTDL